MPTPQSSPLAIVREALLDAWALLQPIDCLGCGTPDRACCAGCRAEIRAVEPVAVRCDADPGVPVWCAADYEGPVRGAVLSLKEAGRVDAARLLGPLLRAAVVGAVRTAVPPPMPSQAGAGPPRLELAPVPTTRRALARRGHDPLRLIIRRARLPSSRVLVPVRTWASGEQKRRGRAGRLAARAGRFRARGRLDGRAFLVVDDLATTGATLAAACDALRAAGGSVIGCVVVAAPDLPGRTIGRPIDATRRVP